MKLSDKKEITVKKYVEYTITVNAPNTLTDREIVNSTLTTSDIYLADVIKIVRTTESYFKNRCDVK